jgi:hypothetical protein
MILGSVQFRIASHDLQADLTETGWQVSDLEFSDLAASLDRLFSPAQYGPADGDPIRLAVSGAAEMLSGQFTLAKLRPLPKSAIP